MTKISTLAVFILATPVAFSAPIHLSLKPQAPVMATPASKSEECQLIDLVSELKAKGYETEEIGGFPVPYRPESPKTVWDAENKQWVATSSYPAHIAHGVAGRAGLMFTSLAREAMLDLASGSALPLKGTLCRLMVSSKIGDLECAITKDGLIINEDAGEYMARDSDGK